MLSKSLLLVAALNYNIEVQELAAQPAVVIKDKVKVEDAGSAIGQILGEVANYIEQNKSHPTGAPFTRTYLFENGILEFESGFPVNVGMSGQGRIVSTELPKGRVATTIHIGSQETSEQAYRAIHEWMEKNGEKAAGAPWEVYLTDPSNTPEDQAKIQVFFPIQ